jgi:hypothetical protein
LSPNPITTKQFGQTKKLIPMEFYVALTAKQLSLEDKTDDANTSYWSHTLISGRGVLF